MCVWLVHSLVRSVKITIVNSCVPSVPPCTGNVERVADAAGQPDIYNIICVAPYIVNPLK